MTINIDARFRKYGKPLKKIKELSPQTWCKKPSKF